MIIENNSNISRNCLLIKKFLSRLQHLLPTSRRLPMVQHAMSAATRAGATNEESIHFLETIFSTPDLGVLALEVWRNIYSWTLKNFLVYDLVLEVVLAYSRHRGYKTCSYSNSYWVPNGDFLSKLQSFLKVVLNTFNINKI